MQKSGIQLVLVVVLTSHLAVGCSTPRREDIQELQGSHPAHRNIPEESVALLRDFISYILRLEPDLFHDEVAQKRFLTEELRKAVAHRWRLYQEFIKKHEAHSPPSNGTFVGAWEYPSGYTIEGGHHSENQVIIDVIYKWENPEANYYGDTRRVSYTLLLEGGTWKLDDAYTHKGEFVPAYSLKKELWRNDHQF